MELELWIWVAFGAFVVATAGWPFSILVWKWLRPERTIRDWERDTDPEPAKERGA